MLEPRGSRGRGRGKASKRWARDADALVLSDATRIESRSRFQNLRTHIRRRQRGRACHTHHRRTEKEKKGLKARENFNYKKKARENLR